MNRDSRLRRYNLVHLCFRLQAKHGTTRFPPHLGRPELEMDSFRPVQMIVKGEKNVAAGYSQW